MTHTSKSKSTVVLSTTREPGYRHVYSTHGKKIQVLAVKMSKEQKALLRQLWWDQAMPEAWFHLAQEINPPMPESDWLELWDNELWNVYAKTVQMFVGLLRSWRTKYVQTLRSQSAE